MSWKDYISSPEELNSETLIELKEVVKEYPSFQLAWFFLLKNMLLLGDKDFDQYLKQAAFHVSSRRKLYTFLHIESHRAERELNQITKEYSTIAPFGSDSKSIENHELSELAHSLKAKQIASPKSTDDASEKESNIGYVTETLAKIYVKQNKFEQAISCYEKLSLKYPEKNTYFATRIIEIKELTK